MDWGPEQRKWFFKRTKTYKNWLPQSDSNQEQIHKMTNQIYTYPTDKSVLFYQTWQLIGISKNNKKVVNDILNHFKETSDANNDIFVYSWIKDEYLFVSARPSLIEVLAAKIKFVTGWNLLLGQEQK